MRKHLDTAKGLFTTDGSGDELQPVTGLGFAPEAVIAWWSQQEYEGSANGNRGGVGFWASGQPSAAACWGSEHDSSETHTHSASGSAALLGLSTDHESFCMRAEVASFDPDGFTIRWTIRPTERWIVHFLALGGTTIRAARVGWVEGTDHVWSERLPQLQARPDVVFACRAAGGSKPAPGLLAGLSVGNRQRQAHSAYTSPNAARPGGVVGKQTVAETRAAIGGPDVALVGQVATRDPRPRTDEESRGADDSSSIFHLALTGVRSRVGADVSPGTPGRARTGFVGFRPDAVMFLTNGLTPSNATRQIGRLALGAASPRCGREGCVSWDDRSTETPTSATHVHSSMESTIVVADTRNAGIHAAASFHAVDDDGFTLDWTQSDQRGRQFVYVALAARCWDGPRVLLRRAILRGSDIARLVARRARCLR